MIHYLARFRRPAVASPRAACQTLLLGIHGRGSGGPTSLLCANVSRQAVLMPFSRLKDYGFMPAADCSGSCTLSRHLQELLMTNTRACLLDRRREPFQPEAWDRFVSLYKPLIYTWGVGYKNSGRPK
jgi:hypothetical protein